MSSSLRPSAQGIFYFISSIEKYFNSQKTYFFNTLLYPFMTQNAFSPFTQRPIHFNSNKRDSLVWWSFQCLFQSFKIPGHANLIPVTSAFLLWSQRQFSAALLLAVYLFIHLFSTLFQKGYSQKDFTYGLF